MGFQPWSIILSTLISPTYRLYVVAVYIHYSHAGSSGKWMQVEDRAGATILHQAHLIDMIAGTRRMLGHQRGADPPVV